MLTNKLNELKTLVNEGQLDTQVSLLKDIEAEYPIEELRKEETFWVLKGEILFRKEEYTKAVSVAEEGLSLFANSYELYYLSGNAYDQLEKQGAACIAYHAAFFWGRNTEDASFLYQNMQQYKDSISVTDWEMTRALEQLIEHRMMINEYEESQLFLKWVFFSEPGQTKGMYLSEGTMLQFIMLEAVLCEKNRLTNQEFEKSNTCIKYQNDYKRLVVHYLEIKHAVRRIWMGMSETEKEYLFDVLHKYDVSPELLVVITKYSVEECYWKSVFSELTAILRKYSIWFSEVVQSYCNLIEKITRKEQKECYQLGESNFTIIPRRIQLSEQSYAADEPFLTLQKKDENKIAIIFCTNDELMERECILYLQHLIIPEGMTLEVLSVWNAKGMCYGYNRVMPQTDARYKIYIHHDCFLIKKDILLQVIDIFRKYPEWSMLGMAGSKVMEDKYCWGNYHYSLVRYNLFQDRLLETILSHSVQMEGKVEKIQAIDGVFIATDKDIPWREDLFDEWHFYDISQCYEFRKRGMQTGIINDDMPWMIHETTTKKDPRERYEFYGQKFMNLYIKCLQ